MSLRVKVGDGITILWPRLPWKPVPMVIYGIVTILLIYCITVGKTGGALILSLFYIFLVVKWASAHRIALFHKNKQVGLYGGFRGRKLLTRFSGDEIDHITVSSRVLQFRRIGTQQIGPGAAGSMNLYTPVIVLKTTDPQSKTLLEINCNFQTTETIARAAAFLIGEFAGVPVVDEKGTLLKRLTDLQVRLPLEQRYQA